MGPLALFPGRAALDLLRGFVVAQGRNYPRIRAEDIRVYRSFDCQMFRSSRCGSARVIYRDTIYLRDVIMARRRCFLPPRPAKVDEAAIGRILHPFRDWRCTGCNHKTFTTRAETVAPPLSSSGSYFLVVDRNKKLQNCGRKRCKSAGAKKTASHYWSLEVPIKLSRPEPSIEGGSLGRLAVSRSVFATRSEYGAVIAGRRRDGHDQALLWSHRAGIQGSALNAKPAGPGTCPRNR